MRNHRRLIFLALSVLAVVVLAWLVFHPRGPTYHGKSLSYWLLQLTTSWPPQARGGTSLPNPRAAELAEAADAIRAMGTNALPQLLEELKSEDSPFKRRVLDNARRIPIIKNSALNEDERRQSIVQAFQILGSRASPAIPALARILNAGDPQLTEQVATILFYVGSNGIPPLVQALSHTNFYVRLAATGALNRCAWIIKPGGTGFDVERIDGLATDIVPALVPLAADTNLSVRQQAVVGLGRFHRQPDIVVPVLIKMLKDEDFAVRHMAISGLGLFGTNAQAAVPALVSTLNDPIPTIGTAATNALRKIDPSALK